MNLNPFKGTETMPTTTEALAEQFTGNKKTLQSKIEKNLRDTADLKLDLEDMSQKLYGTRNFSTKKNYWKSIGLLAALTIVVLFEKPINAMSFEIFNRSQQETILMAYGFAIIIAILAHITGRGFKRSSVGDKINSYGWIGLISAMILFCATASFRMIYMERMHMDSSVNWFWQFVFSFLIFGVGALCSYMYTSPVSNLTLEETFKRELRRFKSLKSELEKMKKEQLKLSTQYLKDYNKIVKDEKDQLNKTNADALNKANANADANNALSLEFDDLEKKFNKSMREAHEISKSFDDKKDLLDQDVPFLTVKADLSAFLGRAEKIAKSATNGQERLSAMNASFESLFV